jgi:hypothetical protein
MNGIDVRQAVMEGRKRFSGLIVTAEEITTYKQEREQKRNTTSQVVQGNEYHSNNATSVISSLTYYYVALLRDYYEGYAFNKAISPQTDQLLRKLAPSLVKNIQDLSELQIPEVQKDLRHEIYHYQFMKEKHRKILGDKTDQEIYPWNDYIISTNEIVTVL